MKKITSLILALVLTFSLVALSACGDKTTDDKSTAASDDKVITVGASATPHAEILEAAKPILAEKGIDLEIVIFDDYVQPNLSLNDKELDANFFQHKPYLDDFSAQRGLKLASLVAVHIEPMGVYSKSVKAVAETPEGAKVAIPNDPTNGGRALKVLETAGLIKLKDGVGVLATVADVAENPKNLKFVEIEAAQLPRSLDDVALAVINSNFALGANLNPVKDAIAIEAKDSPYANIVAVRAGDESRPEIQKLKAALTTPDVKKFLEEKYQGAVVPAF